MAQEGHHEDKNLHTSKRLAHTGSFPCKQRGQGTEKGSIKSLKTIALMSGYFKSFMVHPTCREGHECGVFLKVAVMV